jgi:hypothetical protein
MKTIAPFGFVTGCYAKDKFMVQATLASMRHFCPTIPICLIVDGDVDVSNLEKEYKLIILRILDLPSPEMRKLMSGNFKAKLAAMWEGPFEFYVWMDSDAIVWGDFTPQVRQDLDFQIFWKEVEQLAVLKQADGFKHYYFDPDLLKEFDPTFRCQGNVYFSAGVYACRKNVISLDAWLQMESWNQKTGNKLFKFGDMGIINYLVHSMSQRGKIKIASSDLQHVWAHHGKQELENDCARAGWHFPKSIVRPRVAHFCYRKPVVFDPRTYSRPFTIARLEHHRRSSGEIASWLAIYGEDGHILLNKIKRRLKRLIVLSLKY